MTQFFVISNKNVTEDTSQRNAKMVYLKQGSDYSKKLN